MRIRSRAGTDPQLRDMVRGTAVAFTLRVVGAALTFATNVVIARFLGATGTGVYFLAFTVTSVTVVAGRVGLDNIMLRHGAIAASEGAWDRLHALYRTGMTTAWVAAFAVSIAGFAAAPTLGRIAFHDARIVTPLRIMMISVAPGAIVYLHAELLKALHRITAAIVLQSVALPAISIPLLVILAPHFGVAGAAISYASSSIIALVVAVLVWRSVVPQHDRRTGSFASAVLLRSAPPLFIIAILNLVSSWSDTLMLGLWADSRTVGIYAMASRTALMTSFILVAANSVLAPRFSAAFAAQDHVGLTRLARRAARLTTAMAAPILLVLIGLPEIVLSIFGPSFREGAIPLRILCVGQFINAATGSVGYLLMMTGHERAVRNTVGVAAAANIVGNTALIPTFGPLGAAAATAGAVAIQNLTLLWQVRRHLKIRIW